MKQYSRQGIKWPGVGECPVPFVSATCLKTSSLSLFPYSLLSTSSPFSFRLARVFTKRKRMRGREREKPDPLIVRHSCSFVRHLIASRGSRGILRGGYLVLSSPTSRNSRVQVSGMYLRTVDAPSIYRSFVFATSDKRRRSPFGYPRLRRSIRARNHDKSLVLP